jgi:hypothetical protein
MALVFLVTERCFRLVSPQGITRSAPAVGVFLQGSSFEEIEDVTVGGVPGASGELGPFGCSELALAAI